MSSTPPFDSNNDSLKWSRDRSVPNQRAAYNRPQFNDNRQYFPYNDSNNISNNRYGSVPQNTYHNQSMKATQYQSPLCDNQPMVNQFNSNVNMNQSTHFSYRDSVLNEVNRGVYSSDIQVIQMPSVDTLRSIINTTTIKKESDNSKSNKSSNDLTEDLRETDYEANKMNKLRKNIETKLKDLEEELKYYEEKLKLRDTYKEQLMEINNKEEFLAQKRTKLIEELSSKNISYGNEVSTSTDKDIVKREKIKIVVEPKETIVDKTQNKRPLGVTPNITSTPIAKRAKLDSECEDELKKLAKDCKTPIKSSSDHQNIRIKPLIDVKAQKTNQAINKSSFITPNKTSGVKTSRPQKPGTSRAFRETESTQSDEQTISVNNNETIPTSTEYDDAFNDILKCVSQNESVNFPSISVETNKETALQTSDKIPNSDKNIKHADSVNVKKNIINEKVNDTQNTVIIASNPVNESKIVSKISDKIATLPNIKNTENLINNEPNELNKQVVREPVVSNSDKAIAQHTIEVVELIDDEEVFTTEPTITVKEEKVNLDSSSKNIMQKISHVRESTDSTDSNTTLSLYAQENAIKQIKVDKDMDKTPPKKLTPKFYGWKVEEYPSATKYSLPSFRAFSGPRTKTCIVKLISFKDYIFASFGDNSVRRYTNSNDEDEHVLKGLKSCLKFEGHSGVVWDLKIICADVYTDTYHLYTVCNDKMLRRFNPNTAQLLRIFNLEFSIYCIDYCWSNVFIGQMNGFVAKIKSINEISDDIETDKSNNISENKIEDNAKTMDEKNIPSDDSIERFCVVKNRRIMRIRAIRTEDPNIEPIIAISNNKLRIINTKSSVDDSERVLFSMIVDFDLKSPIHMNVYENYMFLTSTLASKVKIEETKKYKEESYIYIYDLRKLQKPIRQQPLESHATSLEFNKEDVLLTCFKGEVRCFDANKLELKWMAYHNGVITASINFGDRVVVGDQDGSITAIYLDSERPECDKCYVRFARKMDLKEHIMKEHPLEQTESNSSKSSTTAHTQ